MIFPPRRRAVAVACAVLAAAPLPASAAQSAPQAAAGTPVATFAGGSSAPADAGVTIYRGDSARTGYVSATVSVPASVAWQNTTQPQTANHASPIIHDGLVFFGSGGAVYAVNVGDGATRWSLALSPTSAQQVVGNIVATVNTTPAFDCPATIAGGKLFVGNDNGKLYACDEKTGAVLWQFATGGPVRSAPVVDNGVVYFGSLDSKLYAVRIDTQKPAWGGEFASTGPITTPPALGAGGLYFVDGSDRVFAVSEETGRVLWQERINGASDSPPLFAGGAVVVGAGRDVYGFNPRVGSQEWHVSLPVALSAPICAAPGGDDYYAVLNDGRLIEFNLRGRILWQTALDSPNTTTPVLTQNLVIVASRAGILNAVDAASGQVRWSYSLHTIRPPRPITALASGDLITSTPLVSEQGIYTLYNDGTLTAFRAGAIDSLPPLAVLAYPFETEAVPGAQIPYFVYLGDTGSGINPSSVTLSADNVPLPVQYVPEQDAIEVKQVRAGELGLAPTPLPTLADGAHTLTVKATDWRGNTLTQSWQFTVDNRFDPPGSALPTGTGGLSNQVYGGGTDAPITTPGVGDSGAPGAGGGSGAPGAGGGSGAPDAGGGGNGSPGSSGEFSGGSGGGGSTSAPAPPAPTGPAPAPPAGAGGFPPPPPI